MKKCFASEHGGKLFRNALKKLLDGSRISNESRRHFQTSRWNVTDRCLHVTWYPFDEVSAVFVLYVQHLFIDFFHRHPAAKNSRHGEVLSMTRIASSHHIFGIKHLLASGCQWCEPGDEEMKTGKWYHVDSKLS
ncbi:GSCOCG00005542001-RA-CDS [Cotesia congregata]|nr:GSCOCG00005542001-RA-CDS [Cotesia congregata]